MEVQTTKKVTNYGSQDNQDSKPVETREAPDGGFGWLVVLCCFVIEGYVFGTMRCFSVFFNPFQEEFKTTSNSVSWIPSICLATLHSSGLIASQMSKRLGARTVVMVGGLLTFTGFFAASFAENIIFVYLGIGLASGLGFGLLYIPSNVIVGQYFNKRKSLAFCIISTGGPVASFVFAPLFQVLVDRYSLNTVLKIIACILSTATLCGIAMTPPKKVESRPDDVMDSVFEEQEPELADSLKLKCSLETIQEVEVSSLTTTLDEQISDDTNEITKNKTRPTSIKCKRFHSFGGVDTVPLIAKSKRHDPKAEIWTRNVFLQPATAKKRVSFNTTGSSKEHLRICNVISASVPDQISVHRTSARKSNATETSEEDFIQGENGLQWGLLTQSPFLIYCLVGLCIGAGAFTPNVFLVPLVVSRGYVSLDAAILVSIMSGVSIISSLASGWIIALSSVLLLYYDVASLFLLGLSCLLCPFATTYYQLVIFCVCFGLFLGAVMALPFSVLCEIVGTDCLFSGFAFFMMVTSVAVLITPPVAGWLVDVTGSYDAIFYLSGVALILASLGVLFITLCSEASVEEIEEETNKDSQNVKEGLNATTSFSAANLVTTGDGGQGTIIAQIEKQKATENQNILDQSKRQRIRRQSVLLTRNNRSNRRDTELAAVPEIVPTIIRRKSLI
uniref:Uncharacterized protein LOC100182912 n=1 Tax=Phallusia mammillata TaxID=59560 RepID=A0A6F9DH20_9ASCI|nr:uncharacterized protein LOC100182912 [Phallusia mammillata]